MSPFSTFQIDCPKYKTIFPFTVYNSFNYDHSDFGHEDDHGNFYSNNHYI